MILLHVLACCGKGDGARRGRILPALRAGCGIKIFCCVAGGDPQTQATHVSERELLGIRPSVCVARANVFHASSVQRD